MPFYLRAIFTCFVTLVFTTAFAAPCVCPQDSLQDGEPACPCSEPTEAPASPHEECGCGCASAEDVGQTTTSGDELAAVAADEVEIAMVTSWWSPDLLVVALLLSSRLATTVGEAARDTSAPHYYPDTSHRYLEHSAFLL